MDPFYWGLVLKGLGLIAFFGVARVIAMGIFRVMPDSNLKRFLFEDVESTDGGGGRGSRDAKRALTK